MFNNSSDDAQVPEDDLKKQKNTSLPKKEKHFIICITFPQT
jgi:hypothetical protein